MRIIEQQQSTMQPQIQQRNYGAGGIINDRAAVLILAVTDSSFYNYLCLSDQERVHAIQTKGAIGCDSGDNKYMASLLKHVCEQP